MLVRHTLSELTLPSLPRLKRLLKLLHRQSHLLEPLHIRHSTRKLDLPATHRPRLRLLDRPHPLVPRPTRRRRRGRPAHRLAAPRALGRREPGLDLARVLPLVEDALLDLQAALELAEEGGAVGLGLEAGGEGGGLVLGAEGGELGDGGLVGEGGREGVRLDQVEGERDGAVVIGTCQLYCARLGCSCWRERHRRELGQVLYDSRLTLPK